MKHLLTPLLLLTLLTLAACGSDGDNALPADEAKDALVDRNWLDTWPGSSDDRLHVYRFTPSMGGGVYQDRDVFEGSFELFKFSHDGQMLKFDFPGKSERHETAYRIERVEGPHPFTLKLTLDSSPRGPSTYYGWNERATESPFALEP